MGNGIIEEAQIAAGCTKAVSRPVEDRGEWVDSYCPEHEKMPRELGKTNVPNGIRRARAAAQALRDGGGGRMIADGKRREVAKKLRERAESSYSR